MVGDNQQDGCGEPNDSEGSEAGSLIQRVRVSDLRRVAELEEAAFGKEHAWSYEFLRATYEVFGKWWLAVWSQGVIWGHCITAFDSDDKTVAWILGLAVHPERRGRQYGEGLLLSSFDLLADHDAHVVRLVVDPHNTTARDLYRRVGFIDHNELLPDYFGPGMHRVMMTKLLREV